MDGGIQYYKMYCVAGQRSTSRGATKADNERKLKVASNYSDGDDGREEARRVRGNSQGNETSGGGRGDGRRSAERKNIAAHQQRVRR